MTSTTYTWTGLPSWITTSTSPSGHNNALLTFASQIATSYIGTIPVTLVVAIGTTSSTGVTTPITLTANPLSFNILVISPCALATFTAGSVTSADSGVYTTFDTLTAASTGGYPIKDGITKTINFNEATGSSDSLASSSINICGAKSYAIMSCTESTCTTSPAAVPWAVVATVTANTAYTLTF